MKSRLFILAAASILAAAPAAAQRPGSIELDGFGSWTRFDNSLQLKNRFGAGGLLGIFFVKNVAVEGDASYTRTHLKSGLPGDFSYIPIRARLAAHVPLGSSYSRLIFGAGYVAARYREDLHVTDDGFTGLVGLKLGLSRHVGLRADGIIDYLPIQREPDGRLQRALQRARRPQHPAGLLPAQSGQHPGRQHSAR